MEDAPRPRIASGAPPPLPARPSSAVSSTASTPLTTDTRHQTSLSTASPPSLPPRRAIQVSVTPATPEMGSPADTQTSPARAGAEGVPQTAPLPHAGSTDGNFGTDALPSVGGTEDVMRGQEQGPSVEQGQQYRSDAALPAPAPVSAIRDPPTTAPPSLQPLAALSPHPSPSLSPSPPPQLPPRPASPFNPAKAEAALINSAANMAKDTALAATRSPLDVGLALVMAGLVMVAYWRLATWWLCLAGVGGLVYLHAQAQGSGMGRAAQGEAEGDEVVGRMKGDAKAAVQWVNHALYALFPLVSTDVLTPFIDLLEDALLEKVPPIVTSVRLDAPALGNQPLLLTSMRPMTDEEWFASVSTPSKDAKAPADVKSPLHPGAGPGHRTSGTAESSRPHNLTGGFGTGGQGDQGRRRSASGGSLAATPPPRSRRSSRASMTSYVDEGEVLLETERRRKRDAVLSRLQRRQRQKASDKSGEPHDGELDDVDLRTPISVPIREGAPNGLHSTVTSADGVAVDDEMDEDNPLTGQYVNYQVGFEYHRRDSTKRKGYGLHVLAYFGVGVKGIGKTELPVYIDMLSIKGTLNIRLLLSPNPPFARTATISFPRLPEFDISAKPLTRSTFNAMQLPGMKPYVQASISDVARAFVRPNSYTVDVDRLLLGREANMRTASMGVLQIVIHSAEDLPKMDAMGTCDPYVAISYSKYNKPIFSTRTIVDNQNPSWEEPAFCLVSTDEVEGGEFLRLRISDSDRFSADDVIGQVEVELAELIDTTSEAKEPIRRRDEIQADRPGMRAQGYLTWSVRFVPLWQMPEKELNERMKSVKTGRPGECDEPLPQWMEWLAGKIGGDKPDWAKKREERNKETLAWFTGAHERDALEAMAKPNENLRSGVLQFHIHQLTDLEVESADGTYSAKSSARKSAAGGKPALSDLIDRTAAENPDPPSAYVEVHLNDRLIYRTRTKQLTPMPYFNAVGERFLRDWRMAKLVFVVRDERDREHDPILGIVTMRLENVFSDRSQFTRWYPIIGGLGWGRIRLSLLWKPVDMDLPARVSGFEVATLEIKSLVATDLSRLAEKKGIAVALETEADRYTIASDEGEVYSTTNTPCKRSISISSLPPTPSTAQTQHTPSTAMTDDGAEMEWDLTKPIKLAVEYRHSCSVLISFITRHGVMRKKKVIGLASVRLNEVEDWVDNARTVPIFATASVKDAIQAYQNYMDVQQGRLSLVRFPEKDVDVLGFVSLDFCLRPGVSRAHARLAKKDMRFKRVYEAWELEREVRLGLTDLDAKSAWRADRPHLTQGDDDEDDDHGSASDTSDEERGTANIRRTASGRTTASMRREMEAEDEEVGMSERRAHSKALHKRNKGIFQLKIARTGKFVKDSIEAKLYARANDRRVRGQDVRVEHEGQSKL